MKHLALLGFLVLGASSIGCTAIDRETDCQSICSRYRDCINTDYNVSSCQDRCVARAERNDEKDNDVDICNACIDNRSCTSATFNCLSECSGIVP